MEPHSPAELFPHIRVVMGTIVGLGVTRLLMTAAGMVQHPQRGQRSLLHLLWMGSILLELILFWWWQFALFGLRNWTFGIAIFIVFYAITLFMLAALLSPDRIGEYDGYEDFFIKRRNWFFGILACTFALDTIDALIKGGDYLHRLDISYYIQVPFGIVLCLVALRFTDRRLQLAVVGTHIAYQIYMVTQFFETTSY